MIGKMLGRVIWILIAYLISAFAAGLTFVVSAAGVSGAGLFDMTEILATSILVSSAIAAFAFVPAMAAIVIAEIFRFQSWIYYALTGAVAAFISIGGADMITQSGQDTETGFITLFLAAGLVAGLVYWLTAGREAGKAFRALPDTQTE